MTETLAELASAGELEALEAMWFDRLEDPGPTSEFLEAFAALPEDGLRTRLVPSMQLLLESCQTRGLTHDVLAVVRALAPLRRRSADLHAAARDAYAKLHGDEPWLDLFLRLSRLGDESEDLEDALRRFRRLSGMVPGRAVNHATGWGEGLVTAHDLDAEELTVRFRSDGMERSMPFTTALDVLIVLPRDDLRARVLTDLEGLQEEAENEPNLLVRAVARLGKGRATSKDIKLRLDGVVVPSRSWASWWKKAKAAALHDPLLAVENPSRPVFVLRERAVSAEDELRGAMDRAPDLAGLLDVVRGPLSLDPSPELKAQMIERLERAVADGGGPVARVEAALLLARHGAWTLDDAGRVVDEVLDDGGFGFADLAAALSGAGLRKEAFEALRVGRPQLWSDAVVGCLGELPPQLLDTVAERLVAEGRGDALANRFAIFLMAPSRQPAAVLRLARRYVDGLLDDVEERPSLTDVTMGVLHLAETQAPRAARRDKAARDVMTGVEDLLVGKTNLAGRFAETADRADLELALGVIQRVRSMPDGIVTGLRAACTQRFPDLAPRDEIPFWQRQAIFCTRDAIAARQEELRELIEVKLPENREQIGRAAAYGDLSENFEWASAIEQQRQLTERIAAMEAELRLAQAIEDQEPEEGVVAPGTRVTFEQGGETKQMTILGPWDKGDGVVSYRAPLAAGMLGRGVGDEATLELPSGEETVRITAVESAV